MTAPYIIPQDSIYPSYPPKDIFLSADHKIKTNHNLNKKGKIYYINNDISLFQGWCEGCIEIVDELLHNLYNMPNYLNV